MLIKPVNMKWFMSEAEITTLQSKSVKVNLIQKLLLLASRSLSRFLGKYGSRRKVRRRFVDHRINYDLTEKGSLMAPSFILPF